MNAVRVETACTIASHDTLKRDAARFLAETTFIGVQRGPSGVPAMSLHNCNRCHSTLAVRVVVDEPVALAVAA